MRRFDDWPTRLQRYIDASICMSFRYGQHDCCLFTADCIRAMTGADLAEWFRGRYATRKDALALIRERTGRGNVEAVAEYAAHERGLVEVQVAFAQRGDMALIGRGRSSLLGVVSLSGVDVMCLMQKQIMRVDFEHVTRVWRI